MSIKININAIPSHSIGLDKLASGITDSFETTTNKKNTINDSEVEYPSSKAVYEGLNNNKKEHTYVITKNDVTVTTDSTKGVSPYNTGYGYTNIVVNTISESDLINGTKIILCCGGSLIVNSSYRNVRIKFGSEGSWIPVYYTTSIAVGSTYFVNGACTMIVYRNDIYASGAFHVCYDVNTTYSNPASFGIGYGTCATEEATVAKVVTLSNYSLQTNGIVGVKFTYAVPASATMNINGKGAKAIYYKGVAISASIIKAGDIATFIYNGSQYHLLTIDSELVGKESTDNKVTSISPSSTDEQYPSAKAVYDVLYKNGFIGTYSTTFTSTSEIRDTGISLIAGKKYIIIRTTEISNGAVKFYNDASVSELTKYTRLHGALSVTCYEAKDNGNLKIANTFFNKSSDGIFAGNITINVYSHDSYYAKNLIPSEYTVSKSNSTTTGYISTTDLFMDLQFNEDVKTIYIESGEYDIYQEYADYQMPVYSGSGYVEGFPDYCVYIPTNSHVIGKGTVKLIYMPNPTTQSITLAQSYTVSTVNVGGTMTLENVEIYSKNCRYAIHDDTLGVLKFNGARKKYINVKCYKYSSDTSIEDPTSTYGFEYAFGSGIDKEVYMEFDSCQFWDYQTDPYASFLLHDRQYMKTSEGTQGEEVVGNNSPSILFRNTLFMSNAEYCLELNNIRRKTWNPHMHIPTTFENCFFSGVIALDGSHGVNVDRNSFDVKLVHCNDVKVDVWDAENEYPVQIFNDYITEIDYNSLKSLRDNSKLVQGCKYCITDYTCTTTKAYTQSAGHLFDIIVTAIDCSHLNEEAQASHHSGDTYFANSNLNAWKIWYCLDNDTTRFEWADSVNGKGIIYRMIDEFNNDVPYDFKNIQFLRGWCSDALLPSLCCVVTSTPSCLSETQNASLLTIPCYTFSNAATSGMTATTDNSIDGSQTGNLIMDNIIKPVYADTQDKRELNNICFFGNVNYSNTIDVDSFCDTFGSVCAYNKFDAAWQKNIIYSGTYNLFGQGSWGNDLISTISNNKSDSNFRFNKCSSNIQSGKVKGKFNDNRFGTFCTDNDFSINFSCNDIKNHCHSNVFANYFQYNTVGIDFQSNTFRKSSSDNTVSEYFKFNIFDNYIHQYYIQNNTNGDDTNCVSFYHFESSSPIGSTSPTTIEVVRNNRNTIIVGRNSTGTVCQGNLFDMIGNINTVLDDINGEII